MLAIKITHRLTRKLTPEAQYIQCPELQLSALICSVKGDFHFVTKSQHGTKNIRYSWLCPFLAEVCFGQVEGKSSTSPSLACLSSCWATAQLHSAHWWLSDEGPRAVSRSCSCFVPADRRLSGTVSTETNGSTIPWQTCSPLPN